MEGRFERAESRWRLAPHFFDLLSAGRPSRPAFAGLAQARLKGPADDDAISEGQVRNARDAAGSSPPGKSRGLSVPARAWIAVGAAALLWGIVAAMLALIV